MSKAPSDPGSQGDRLEPTPRWVYVFGAVLVVLVVLFVALHLAGRGLGGHGS